MAADANTHKPGLVLRLGIVGHRANRLHGLQQPALDKLVAAQIDEILRRLEVAARQFQDLYAGASQLKGISALAEGADRAFIRALSERRLEYDTVLPMPAEEYQTDFKSASSILEFETLLKGSEATLELDGSHSNAAAAYAHATEVVLNMSDLLLIVWDGERKGLEGGTESAIRAIETRSIPALWLNPAKPDGWVWLRSGSVNSESNLDKYLHRLFGLPGEDPTGSKSALDRFYSRLEPTISLPSAWPLFQKTVTYVPEARHRKRFPEEPLPPAWEHRFGLPLKTFYDRADQPAIEAANHYRSTFFVGFLFSAIAVGAALTPILFHLEGREESTCAVVEGAIIGAILLISHGSRKAAWHEKWIDFRLVAEQIRHLSIVRPIGGARPYAQATAHQASYGHLSTTWMGWYADAVARQVGLSSVSIPREKNEILQYLRSILTDQLSYHERNVRRMATLRRFLQGVAAFCLFITVASCLAHIFGLFPSGALTFLCGTLPALGSAMLGIENQAEIHRVEKRSESMIRALSNLLERCDALGNSFSAAAPVARRLSDVSVETAQLLLHEVMDWRVIFLDRPTPKGAA